MFFAGLFCGPIWLVMIVSACVIPIAYYSDHPQAIAERLDARIEDTDFFWEPNYDYIHELYSNEPLSNRWFKDFRGLDRLETVTLRGSQIDDNLMDYLIEKRTLSELDLSASNITSVGLQKLKGMNLSKLRIPIHLRSTANAHHYVNALNSAERLDFVLHDWLIEALQELEGGEGWTYAPRELSEFTEQVTSDVERSWPRIDANGDGTIGTEEIASSRTPASMKEADTDKDGEISKEEYTNNLAQRKQAQTDQRLKTTFGGGFGVSGGAYLSFKYKHAALGLEIAEELGRNFPLELKLSGDVDIERVKRIPNLQSLSLKDTGITDAGLTHLKGLSNLKKLYLHRSRYYDYRRARFEARGLTTDIGLAQLKQLNSLQELRLDGCKQITDAGLVHLKGLRNLKELKVYHTQVTKAGIAELKKALPGCAIER